MIKSTKQHWLVVGLGLFVAWSAGCTASYAAKQWVYSRTTRQENCQSLGVTGVAAMVSLPEGQRRGLYITSTQPGGYWSNLGLKPGTVLLTIDNRVIESGSSADSVLKSKKSGSMDYTYVKGTKAGPRLLSNRAQWYEGTIAQMSSGVASSGPEGQKAAHTPLPELEKHMLGLINKDRSQNGGLPAVQQNDALTKLARYYAEYMIKHGNFSHVDPEGRDPQMRAKQMGINCGVYENLAWQTLGWEVEPKLVDAAQAQMMNEPPNMQNHRGNILHPAHKFVGVGIARGNGQMMMVQEFTDVAP